jgi:hypothetical protein
MKERNSHKHVGNDNWCRAPIEAQYQSNGTQRQSFKETEFKDRHMERWLNG